VSRSFAGSTLSSVEIQRIHRKGETMKKPNLTKKLTLSRETLRMLADSDLKEVAGGHSGNEATKCTRCQTCTI
jgi:hypothetical protein